MMGFATEARKAKAVEMGKTYVALGDPFLFKGYSWNVLWPSRGINVKE
jgi:hypothetical protein